MFYNLQKIIINKLLNYLFKILNYILFFAIWAVVWDYFDIIQLFKFILL